MTYFWQNPVFHLREVGPRASFLEPNSRWTTKYRNQLPDSAFLIVRKGCGTKRAGRTHPLGECRSLPVKDKQGRYSCAHLRNAEARANQVEGVSEAERRRAKKRASALYDKHCR